jgi:hypothetical protein
MNNKPITLVREELIQNIVDACNNSGLPFFAIEDVLVALTTQIHAAARQQLEEDKKRYQEQMDKQSE